MPSSLWGGWSGSWAGDIRFTVRSRSIPFDSPVRRSWTVNMEVRLQPEQEAQLAQIAAQRGLNPDELAQQVLNLYLEDDKCFIEATNVGVAAAERGDFVEHDEVGSNIGVPSEGGLGSAIAALFAKHRSEIGEDDVDFEIPEFKGYELKDPFSE